MAETGDNGSGIFETGDPVVFMENDVNNFEGTGIIFYYNYLLHDSIF